ncbi:Eaa prophage protein [Enterobacter hormaechei]|nr:Eaa prophage protein [Enterobacter hormaechei]
MITLTKEWLLKTIAELEEERDATPGTVNEDAAMALAAMKIALASVPDDVSGPLAHAYKELTPTFMRNHIDVFERYGIYPDGSAGIQAMRIALDGMNRRAAMLQGAEQTNYRAIVERIAEIVHGKVTDIDLLTVTVKSIKDNLQGKASLRDEIRSEHAEWSQYTFGDAGPVGPLKHLSKEALEAAAEPEDLSEWADMQFLLWDAQRRAGITDEKITQALIDKLAVNKARQWPEPKDGEPRLHIKSGLKLEGQEKQKK